MRRLPHAVEHGGRLSGDVNLDEFAQVKLVNCLPDGVAFKGEDIVGILLRVGECPLPEAISIGGLLPDAVVPLVNRMAQRNAGAFNGSDVVAEIHQQRSVLGQALQPGGEFTFELSTRTHVDLGFLETDRSDAPDRGVTRHHERQKRKGTGGAQTKFP